MHSNCFLNMSDLSLIGLYNGRSGPITGGGSGRSSRPYCCPSNDVPQCEWRGSAPFCNGKCHDDEVEVSSDTAATGAYCFTGHKVLCCKSTKSDETIGKCKWYGSAPACAFFSWGHAGCPSGLKELTFDKYGSGGESGCYPTGGYKSFCCPDPPPYTGCDWYYHGNKFFGSVPGFCGGGCPDGKYPIASDPFLCITGAGLYCCDSPKQEVASLTPLFFFGVANDIKPDPAQSTVHNLLNTFKNDPTCSAGERAFSKRGIDYDATYPIEARAGQILSPTQETTLITALTAMALAIRNGNGGSSQQLSVKTDFESTLGSTLNLTAQVSPSILSTLFETLIL